jgi:hypothetical protein
MNTNLNKLKDALTELVAILELDPSCQWTNGFKSSLAKCEELIQNNYNEDDLRSLSSSVTSVFQGMGSFNDYAPGKYNPITKKYDSIPGTECFERASNEVFNWARQLRVRVD